MCLRARGTRTYGVGASSSVHDLADDLLEVVLLRLPSPVSLVRAAATCRPWRQVIAGAGFLRRFRSLHSPHVLGHFSYGSCTVFVPSPAPPGEAAAVDVSRLVSLGFLPSTCHMRNLVLTDCRDGLLAFVHGESTVMVCDPWTRQCMEVHVVASPGKGFSLCLAAFLLGANAEKETCPNLSNFRVLYVCPAGDEDDDTPNARLSPWVYADFVGRVGGSLFFSAGDGDNMLQVDEITGESSFFTLPTSDEIDGDEPCYNRQKIGVVGGDIRDVRVLRIIREQLEVLRFSDVREAYVLEKTINPRIGRARSWRFLNTAEAAGDPSRVVLALNEEYMLIISVDIETAEVKLVGNKNRRNREMLPYELPWPPTMNVCL
ncbi:hypothetical protein ACP70R_032392 [Stipagrostis hirtigluma subsp. patula]